MHLTSINDCAYAFIIIWDHKANFGNTISCIKLIFFLNLYTGVTKQNGKHYTVHLKCIYDCAYVFLSIHKNTTRF